LQGKTEQDVQTTCKDWFDVKAGKAVSASAQALAKQIASGAVLPRQLTDVQLLAKVYYNRGVSQLETQDYASALDLLKTSLALDPEDEPARNNLLAAYNNWALKLCDAGNFAAASDKLAAGRAIDAQYGPLQTNDLYVHQKWVLDHCQRGRYSAAIEILEQGHQRRPDVELFDGGRFAVYGMWARTLLEGNRLHEALAVLDSARRRYGNHEELVKQELQAFESGLSRLIQQGDSNAARAMQTAALARHPEAASMQKLPVK
jgi:tetratricopeptide (TPR) repeat protein